LGRPTLNFFDLFLRETLQNSWDARTEGSHVEFDVDAWELTPPQQVVLRDVVFGRTPLHSQISDVLATPTEVLVVSDSGTRGLAGPTRADVATDEGTDFVDLVRNTGRDISKGFAGGTYGFGKAVLFQASQIATVVIFSRTRIRSELVNRLIAMNLGSPYEVDGRRYTGRHWWGVHDGELIQPLQGDQADWLATALGLTRLPSDRTGTSIMVIAPDRGDVPLREVLSQLARAATDYAWAHMVSTADRAPDINFSFRCESEEVHPPDPITDPRLRHFVEAYRRCEVLLAEAANTGANTGQHWPWTVEELRSRRPNRRLGVLAHRDYRYIPTGSDGTVPSEIALMRQPRFVVQYRPVKAAPSGLATAGVFIACSELDEEFAKAEPASHDDWRPENLGLAPNQRNPVRQTLDAIRNCFRVRRTTPDSATESTHHPGTVTLAARLGRLLDGTVFGSDTRVPAPTGAGYVPGDTPSSVRTAATDAGAGQGKTGRPVHTNETGSSDVWRRPGGVSAKPRAVLAENVRVVSVDGGVGVEFTVDVTVPESIVRAIVTAEPYVLVDGGRETEPPAGAEMPTVLTWRNVSTGEVHTGAVLTLERPGVSRWQLTVRQPKDAAVSMRIQTTVADNT
jgi:hypothetical protein